MPLIEAAWERRKDDPDADRQAPPAAAARGGDGRGAGRVLPVLLLRRRGARRAEAKPTTRAEDILGWAPDYWAHYDEQASATTRSSIPAALARRHPRARARDRRDGRRLQRHGRGASRQRPQPRRRAARLRRRRGRRDRSAAARPTAGSSRCLRRAPCPRHLRGWSRCSPSTRSSPPRRRGRAPDATRCARWPPTRSCCRSTRRSASTASSPPRTASTCRARSAGVTGRLLLGVDGGNTKTIALVAREDGTILGAGRAGCSITTGRSSRRGLP